MKISTFLDFVNTFEYYENEEHLFEEEIYSTKLAIENSKKDLETIPDFFLNHGFYYSAENRHIELQNGNPISSQWGEERKTSIPDDFELSDGIYMYSHFWHDAYCVIEEVPIGEFEYAIKEAKEVHKPLSSYSTTSLVVAVRGNEIWKMEE